jgi:hypothetical protein
MDAMIATLRQAVLDVRRAGDWLAAGRTWRPRASAWWDLAGRVVGSLTAGVDDHFGRSVSSIGGGDLRRS